MRELGSVSKRWTSAVTALGLFAGCSGDPEPAAPAGGGSSGASGAAAGLGGASAGGSSGGSGGSAAGASGATTQSGASNGGLGGLGSGGAGGGTGGQVTYGAAFKEVAQILESRCASVCHGGQEGFEGRNDLRTVDLGRLYNHLTTPLTSDLCFGKRLIVPNNIPMSFLITAITGSENDCALPRMPAGCEGDACVPASDIAKFEAWIASGAPKTD